MTRTLEYADLRQQALRMRRAGMSVPQIADELDVPRITVYSWVPREEDLSQFTRMAQMREAGKTTTEIASAFGVSRQRVSAIPGPSTRRGRRRDPRTPHRVRLTGGAFERVTDIAAALGITIDSGQYAGQGSVAGLLEEIARGSIIVQWRKGHNRYSHLIDGN